MKFLVGVKGIIKRGDGKILAVRRSMKDKYMPGIWETPGGRMDEASKPHKELEREIKEEVNLRIDVKEPFNVFTLKGHSGNLVIGITFLCNYKSGKVKLSHEHDAYNWIIPNEFKKLRSNPSLHREIENYSKKYGK